MLLSIAFLSFPNSQSLGRDLVNFKVNYNPRNPQFRFKSLSHTSLSGDRQHPPQEYFNEGPLSRVVLIVTEEIICQYIFLAA